MYCNLSTYLSRQNSDVKLVLQIDTQTNSSLAGVPDPKKKTKLPSQGRGVRHGPFSSRGEERIEPKSRGENDNDFREITYSS